jgi:hypothetical protein
MCHLSRYYHVLWVSKYQRVSKWSFLRDRRSKIADPCYNISPIYYTIIDHKKNQSLPLCLLCDVADITREDSKFDLNSPGFKHHWTEHCTILNISSMYAIKALSKILEHPEQRERRYRRKIEFAWQSRRKAGSKGKELFVGLCAIKCILRNWLRHLRWAPLLHLYSCRLRLGARVLADASS